MTLADIEDVAASTSTKKEAAAAPPSHLRSGVTTPLFSDLSKRWTRHLRTITIADLIRKAVRLPNTTSKSANAIVESPHKHVQ